MAYAVVNQGGTAEVDPPSLLGMGDFLHFT